MATTRITDIVPVKTFSALVEAKLTEQSKFRQSGIVGTDPRVTAKAQTAGLETTLREWKRPAGGSAANGSDDDSVKASPKKLQQSAMIARILSRSESFSAMDIADFASDAAAIEYAASEFARLRASDEESALLSILTGVIADNVANDSGDMVKDTKVTTGSVLAASLLNATTLINARATMGDQSGVLSTLVLHSDVVNYLRKNEPNAFVPASQSRIGLETYMGYTVIETDNVTKTGTGTYAYYDSYLVGEGLFAYASAPVDNALVQVRDELAGNGTGMETILNRWRYILHPAGFSNQTAPSNGVSQSNTELATATTWDRIAARKAIPLVKLVTNIA